MSNSKKRIRSDRSPDDRRKKSKTESSPDAKCAPDSDNRVAEILSSQTIREGMLILGCVTEIKKTFLVISLPGCLTGIVPMTNISKAFNDYLRNFSENPELEEISLDSFIQSGMVFSCKVMEISHHLHKGKPSIVLSINPEDVNAELKPSSLYLKMMLYVSVSSVEDHGYIVDVGNNCIKGFLPRQECENSQELNIGQVIPTCIKKINFSSKTSAKIQLSLLDFNEEFTEVTGENIKLHSILPGAKFRSDVIEVQHPFVFTKFSCFDACASVLSLGFTYKTVAVGQTIIGTVLYVHPITHMIYFMLNLKPSPELYPDYFGLMKYTSIENLKFQYFYKNCAYYKIDSGTYGFIYVKELPKNVSKSRPAAIVKHVISKACVTAFHYMDNLVQMTTNPSLLEYNIILLKDVQIGDIYEGIVKGHMSGGMFIQICPGLSGFVRNIFMSDVIVTKPESTFPVESRVKCRVLSVTANSQLNLTCKGSLIQLESKYMLSSYESAQIGQFYKGVIVKKSDKHIIVLFFNHIKGISPAAFIPEGSIFYEGQVVTCEIIKCIPIKQKLVVSLKFAGRSLIQERVNFFDKSSKLSANVSSSKSLHTKCPQVLSRFDSEIVGKSSTISLNQSVENNNDNSINTEKMVKAKIISMKKCQLNIAMDKLKGRVHITELGCLTEKIYPLKEFSVGQEVEVFIFGEYEKRKRNYVEVTSRNTVFYKECTLNWPPLSLSLDLKTCDTLLGFVKEVHEVSAVLWLTPTQTGLLDFLHFSENLKVVKNLQQHLKLGLSLKVSVLKCQERNEGQNFSITLTKIGEKLPIVGENILGLVQVACLEKGLTLQLPFGYNGTVALTDLTDVYIPAQKILQKYEKLKFLKCCVLEVNHQTKHCQLSLRKSIVYSQKTSKFCPEITENSIEEGMVAKGFVKSITKSGIVVELGRRLEGIVKIHNCKTVDCGLCNIEKNTLAKYPIGSVVEVVVKEKSLDGKSLILTLTESGTVDNSGCSRLTVSGDIPWDEMD